MPRWPSHFVGKLRIGAEHVVELACADCGKRRQIDGGGCIGGDDAEHRERDVDRARANANLQVRRILQLRRGLIERLLLELASTGGLFRGSSRLIMISSRDSTMLPCSSA